MRLGLIARADSRGLGVQTKAAFDNLHPVKTMVVDCPSVKPLPLRRDWYPGATWIKGLPTVGDFRVWLQDLDVVYTAETGYGQALWDTANSQGVRTVLHANYEFLDKRDRPTVWAAPSMWHFDDFPGGAVHLPVPIPGFTPNTSVTATRFLHIVGRPAVHDRNGSQDLIAALRYITAAVTVTFRCQEPGYLESRLAQASVPANVTVITETGDVADNANLYHNQDVLVMPRRFGGLCLPVNEAMGAGMPVIMPDISPNDTWLSENWLVPANVRTTFRAKQHVDVYQSDVRALAAKIDQFAQDQEFYAKAKTDAARIAQGMSWERLKPEYDKVFS